MAVLAVIAKQLDELREVCLSGKNVFNSPLIKVEAVCRHLKTIFAHGGFERLQKADGGLLGALSDDVAGNQFCLFVNGDKKPLIAKLCRVRGADSALLLENEGPQFITLDVLQFQIFHFLFHQCSAFLSSHIQQIQNSVAVQTREAFRRANRATFKQTLKRLYSHFHFYPHHSQRRFRFRIAEGCMAYLTAVSLHLRAGETKLLHFGVSASGGFSGLCRAQHG